MTFEVPDRDPAKRIVLSARDREYLKNCTTCVAQQLCGGWSIHNDFRWCNGPGPVCFDDCRAICSRSEEKVDFYARLLGPGNFVETDRYLDGIPVAVPDLNIVGRHAWHPWEMAWPDAGFQLNSHAAGLYQPLYTVSLKHLYYWGRHTWSPQKNLRERFQIHPAARLAITMTCHDSLMDMLEYDLPEAMKRVAAFEGTDFVLAPNFSVYDNYPRLDHLFRIKFKWVALEYLQNHGKLVVPDICFATSADFRNQVAWMRDNHATAMLCNFQVQAVTTETREWLAVTRAAKAIRDALGYRVQLIAYGGVGGARMQSIVDDYGPDVTFLDAKAYRAAEFHKNIELEVQSKDIPVKELFAANCRDRRIQVAAAKKRDPFPALGSEEPLPLAALAPTCQNEQ